MLLHLLPDLPLDNRLMDILEHGPVFLRIRNADLILEGLGIGFEIHNIPTILLLPQKAGEKRSFRYVPGR